MTLKVFGKVELERMLVRKVWDHAIDLNDNFKASKAKVYPLSRNKKEEVQKFVDEHLKKEYIRPFKSPQTSPVFFVGKKMGESTWLWTTGDSISRQLRTTILCH